MPMVFHRIQETEFRRQNAKGRGHKIEYRRQNSKNRRKHPGNTSQEKERRIEERYDCSNLLTSMSCVISCVVSS